MKLSYTDARDYINAHPERHLQRDKSNKGYVCPLCGNGSGDEGTGLRLNPKDKTRSHYKCFRCGFYGDMVELIAQENGITDSSRAFEIARAIYGIEINKEVNMPMGKNGIYDARVKLEVIKEPEVTQDQINEAKSYISKCRDNIAEAAGYLKSRGISLNTASVNGLGYDPDKQAIVIPNGSANSGGYSLRFINPDSKIRYQNAKGMGVSLFIGKGVELTSGILFVTEGAFDALSIREAGFDNVVALNSGNNAAKFIDVMRAVKDKAKSTAKVLIAMDNDDAGKEYCKTLSEGLQGLDIAFEVVELPESVKDVNELFTVNPEALRVILCRITNPDITSKIDAHKVRSLLPEFNAYIKDQDNNRCIPTGFKCFDKAIGGGLYSKMYVIGAISSLGKTTFALQIADSVAQAGNDVVIFSLEMAKEDIIARSISHHTAIIAEGKHNMRLAKTELGITSYNRYKNYSQEDIQVIQDAYRAYAAYAADHVSIYEGRYTAHEIRDTVEQYIRITGHKPLVIIDYLQIVQPEEELKRGTAREQIDEALAVFAAIRRDLKLPVIVISSFNRGSYNANADNTSFKESGGIEYNADAVITLELDIERKANQTKDSNKSRSDTLEGMRGDKDGIRDIKLTLHKNRGNRIGSQVYYRYNPAYNFFVEDLNKNIGNL